MEWLFPEMKKTGGEYRRDIQNFCFDTLNVFSIFLNKEKNAYLSISL